MKQGLIIVAMAATTMLGACGGGGGTSNAGDNQTASSSSGPITSFGSIYVNGIEYDTSGARVYIEDDAASESDLRVGMMVTVVEDKNGKAAAVYHDDDLEGIVLSNSIATGQTTGSMDVMGQDVTVTADTIFESDVAAITNAGEIATGNIVEVSGHSTGTGKITATRLEVKATDIATYLASHAEGIELKGVVQNHDSNAQTFTIGTMGISYAGAILRDLSAGISNDIYVEVKSTTGISGGVLMASVVEREDEGSKHHEGSEGDEYEIHGKVMAINGDSMTIDSQSVKITAETEFEHGNRADIAVGAMVEVEGRFDANGDLVAKKVELEEQHSTNEMTGTVASVNASAPNVGILTLSDGTVIHITAKTIMHDDHDVSPDHHFNLQDIGNGDYVEIHVYSNGDGSYTATKVEREDVHVTAP